MNKIKRKYMGTKKDSIERIFIEDKEINLTEFEVGKKYSYYIDFDSKKVSICANKKDGGDARKVKISKKGKKEDDIIPVLDIRHPDIKKLFDGVKKCVIDVYSDMIVVSPDSSEKKETCKSAAKSIIEKASSKIVDLFSARKKIEEKIAISTKNIEVYLKKASGGDVNVNQISMFDLGFSLTEDFETTSLYDEISKSEKLLEEMNRAVTTSILLKDIKYFEVFAGSGIGGLALDMQGAVNVGYSEVDKFAIKNYDHNFPNRKNFGDISKINCAEIGSFNLLVGGSPCKDISIMKKRWTEDRQVEGLKGEASSLFFEYVRILDECSPNWFIFENVQNLLNSNNGEDFQTVKELFERNYNIKWKVLNTADFGIPQTRRRLYIVGQRKNMGNFDFEFPKEIPLNLTMQDILEDEINEKYYLTEKMKAYVMAEGTKGFKQKAETDLPVARPLTESMHKCHRAGTDNYVTMRGEAPKGKTNLRMLLPKECSRLQGFLDDSYKFIVSDTQAYRLMGNAMSLNVMTKVAYNLGLYIRKTFGICPSF